MSVYIVYSIYCNRPNGITYKHIHFISCMCTILCTIVQYIYLYNTNYIISTRNEILSPGKNNNAAGMMCPREKNIVEMR